MTLNFISEFEYIQALFTLLSFAYLQKLRWCMRFEQYSTKCSQSNCRYFFILTIIRNIKSHLNSAFPYRVHIVSNYISKLENQIVYFLVIQPKISIAKSPVVTKSIYQSDLDTLTQMSRNQLILILLSFMRDHCLLASHNISYD